MGANKYSQQCEFERILKVGDECQAYWTNSGHYYNGKVEVLAINEKSYGVRLLEAVDGYPEGMTLNIPNALNLRKFSWNNRLVPLKEVTT